MRDPQVSESGARAQTRNRWLIDRRVASVLFAAITIGVPLRAERELGDAIAESTLESWLLFGDAALRMLVWVAFTVLIYRRQASRRPVRSWSPFLACGAAILPAMLLMSPSEDAAIWAILVGELVVIVSVGFTLASVLCLGTCFGVLPEVRGLVTRGPYRYVRHPVYLGEIAAFAGFVIASQQPLNVVLLAVFVCAQRVRMGMEEAALGAEFPDEYGAFAARTPRLLPWPRSRRQRGAVAGSPIADTPSAAR